MKKFLLRALFFLIPFLWSIWVCSQPKKEKDCSANCFSSEVIAMEKISPSCTSYEVKVSFSGDCAYELSHFTVGVPCGHVDNIWNSQAWKVSVGSDPTTGISGFKIDDISGFGKGALSMFTVKFTVCTSTEECAEQLKCWQPEVAYKASTCVHYETLAVNCSPLKASLAKTDISCFGANDGSLSVTVEGGEEPYNFIWSDNGNGAARTQLAAGDYSVVVRDASGAELILEESIVEPAKISITGLSSPASCNGAADGAIDITVAGGSSPLRYSWSNGLTTEDLTSLTSGAYRITVTDNIGCLGTQTFTVVNATSMALTETHVKPDCNGTNGSIDVSVAGGTAPYTYQWSNGATTEDLANVGQGVYMLTVRDNVGCSQVLSLALEANNTLVLEGIVTNAGCTTASGKINVTVSGGTAPYTYSWSNGQGTEDLEGLGSGFYTVKVKDAKGCSVTGGFAVSQETFHVPRIIVQPTCSGDDNGSITLQEPIGGTAPFTYEWDNGETGRTLSNLEPGAYTVTVTDANGCSRVITSSITNPAEITASFSVSGPACNDDGSFSIDLNVSGGTSPYTYEWSNGSTTEDVSGLEQGTYTVTITDAHGCSISKEVVVDAGPPAWSCVINESSTTPVCGSENNTLVTSIAGADSYTWGIESSDGNWTITGSANTNSISYTAGGANTSATFTLTIAKDGCTQTCSYTISACQPEDPSGENPGGEEPGGENPGGEEPGGENPGGEEPGGENPGSGGQTCEECFSTTATLVDVSDGCFTYEMVVNSNGLCRHELSHWTLAIPCGSISNYSNSEGWKMEYGKDPTTGLYGLKVDDIGGFGKQPASFTVRFTLCESTNCDLSYWDPTIAYKAGQCVGVETIDVAEGESKPAQVSVYPNPFTEQVQFEWTARTAEVNLEIIDQYGNLVSRSMQPSGKNEAFFINLESASLPRGMYYYRLTVEGRTYKGKISKR